MIKISIIVPVYNVEKYLARCLDSLVNQTLKEIEIICVNDGSTDNSLSILTQYRMNDSRIVIVDKENTGVSDSRNIGLMHAKGMFIAFVDSDDWIELSATESLYREAIENECDIVMCSYIREFETHSKPKIFNLGNKVLYEGEKLQTLHRQLFGPLDFELDQSQSLDSLGTVWAKLYKRELIEQCKGKFVSLNKIGSNEDGLFNMEVMHFSKRIMFVNQPYYHYWKENQNSITNKYNPRLQEQFKCLFDYMEFLIEKYQLNSDYQDALKNRRCLSVLGLGLNEVFNRSGKKEQLGQVKKLLNQSYLVEDFKQFNLRCFPFHWKLFYLFNKKRWVYPTYSMIKVINFLRKVV